ncbi:MAG: hypothetical protein AMXMBFR61_20010 [Fimbriimonadales bacterium]
MSCPRPSLAVIIPAYNEEARIEGTLRRVAEYLDGRGASYRVTVVSDGSTDETERIVRAFAEGHPCFDLLTYSPNRGKGYAVRHGMLNRDGDRMLFSDADLATPIEELEKLEAAMAAGADVAIGSRPLRESRLEVRQPFYREWLGRAFNRFVQLLGVPGIHDTQCGFKLFTHEAAKEIFSRCTYDGFSFDIEALYVARLLRYEIAEVPIVWRHQAGSKVNLLRDGMRMTWDLLKLRTRGSARYVVQPNER